MLLRDPKTPEDHLLAKGHFKATSSAQNHVVLLQYSEDGRNWVDAHDLCFELKFRGEVLVEEIFGGAAKLFTGSADLLCWDKVQVGNALKNATWYGKIKKAKLNNKHARLIWVINRERYDAAKAALLEKQK